MAVDAEFLRDLLNANDPLRVVWERMLAIWRVKALPEELVAYYNERETSLSHFEQALYYGWFELYDLLLEQARQQNGGYVRQWLQADNIVMVADSLSVREVGLLQQELGKRGWRVAVEAFAVAPFPTLTEALAQALLRTNPASGRDTAAFRYRYVAGPGEIPNLPLGEPTLVWLRLPDKELEQVTVAQSTTVAHAFSATVEALSRLLAQGAEHPVFITSDHGYLYATSASHYWEMPSGAEAHARRVFSRESRAKPLSAEGARDLRHHQPNQPEERYFACTEEHVALRGRYWWATASQNDHCTGHGGLSLAECLVPVLSVRQAEP